MERKIIVPIRKSVFRKLNIKFLYVYTISKQICINFQITFLQVACPSQSQHRSTPKKNTKTDKYKNTKHINIANRIKTKKIETKLVSEWYSLPTAIIRSRITFCFLLSKVSNVSYLKSTTIDTYLYFVKE